MPLYRKPDWQTCLHAYLRAHAETPFAYGRFDCGLFAAGAIAAMTGQDPGLFIRGAYRTELGAARLMKLHAGEVSPVAMARRIAAEYGLAEVSSAMAQRGDVVCVGEGREASLGIVALHGTDILGPGASGLVRFPLANATTAWRIG